MTPPTYPRHILLVCDGSSNSTSVSEEIRTYGVEEVSSYRGKVDDSFRSHVLASWPDLVLVLSKDPRWIIALRDLRISVVWDVSEFPDALVKGQRDLIQSALHIATSVHCPDETICEAIEDEFGVSLPRNHSREILLKTAQCRFLLGTGAGFGNILQATPLIRKLAEHLGHPIDVYLETFTPQAVQLLGGSPWTNMVYSDANLLADKSYDKAFITFNAGHLSPSLDCPEILNQRDRWVMNDECKNEHETEFCFKGIESLFPDLVVEPGETSRYFIRDAANYPLEGRVPGEGPVVGICSGKKEGMWARRSWDHFAALAKALQDQGFEVWSLGAPHEYVEGTVDKTGTPLRESILTLTECAYVIGTDGGVFHMAEAAGVPTIALFGPTSVIKNGPLSSFTRVVHKEYACSPCNFKVGIHRCEDPVCMSDITLEDVLEVFQDLRAQMEGGTSKESGHSQRLRICDHEREVSESPYKPIDRKAYLAESFSLYPHKASFFLTAARLNAEVNNMKRAEEILEEGRERFPNDSQLMRMNLESFKPKRPRNRPRRVEDVNLIDVYLTTYQRPFFLKRTLPTLLAACDSSPFEHRVTVLVDAADQGTLGVVDPYLSSINLISVTEQLGLPFSFNLIHDFHDNLVTRSEREPDFVCYIQDDCLITSPEDYFRVVADTLIHALPEDQMGYVSGFYTPIHPGFELIERGGVSLLLSDSIDGKNFVGTPELMKSIGKLTWHFPDGERRGNPGPTRGSHFDLWQWKESPMSTQAQGRVNVIIPGLCTTISQDADTSTWGNSGENEAYIQQRIAEGRIYNTRKQYPTLEPHNYFRGSSTDGSDDVSNCEEGSEGIRHSNERSQ